MSYLCYITIPEIISYHAHFSPTVGQIGTSVGVVQSNLVDNFTANLKQSSTSGSSVSEIAKEASEKLSVNPEDCVIFEMKSTGEKVIFKESDTCIITTISHNGRYVKRL